MCRWMVAALALGLAGQPAMAQEQGGIRLGHQEALLDKVESLAPGCPVARTNTLVGTNAALAGGSGARQSLSSNTGGCQPLVTTQVVAGVNVAGRNGSAASQTLSASTPRGLIATTNVARGYNVAGGRNSLAQQRLESITGP